MPRSLRDAAQEFSLGNATLEDLREAARAERLHRERADEILKLIAGWDVSSDWSRNELRARVGKLVPPPPARRVEGTFYDAGLKPYRRSS